MTTPESSSPAPTPPVAERSPGLIAVAALVVCGFVGGVLVAALLARQTQHDLDQLRTSVSTLQQDLERFRENSKALAVASDRNVLLTFADTGFRPSSHERRDAIDYLGERDPLAESSHRPTTDWQPAVGDVSGLRSHAGMGQTPIRSRSLSSLLEPGQWKTVQATL